MRAGTRHPTPTRPGRHVPRAARAVAAATAPPSGAAVSPPTVGKHFLHIDDWSRDELRAVLDTAVRVKKELKEGDGTYQPLRGKTMAMIFTKPSMRTRVSFETVGGWGWEGGRREGGGGGVRCRRAAPVGRRRPPKKPSRHLPP